MLFPYPSFDQGLSALGILKRKFINGESIDTGTVINAAYCTEGFALGMFTPAAPVAWFETRRTASPVDDEAAKAEIAKACEQLEAAGESKHRAVNINWKIIFSWAVMILQSVGETL